MKHCLTAAFFLLLSFTVAQKSGPPAATKIPSVAVKSPSVAAKKKVQADLNDFVCSLHEETINKVLVAIGDIHGKNNYEVMLISGTYHYTITNSKINVRPDSSSFTCDVKVETGPFDYKTQVLGDVKISYDNDSNKIYIRITRAIFELYTTMFGKKIHIKDIHLEEHFKEPFAFEGPRTISSEFEFMMPDSTLKKVFVIPTECRMQLKHKEICTSCEIAASEVKKVPPIKLIPPIQEVKTGNSSDTTKETSVPGKK